MKLLASQGKNQLALAGALILGAILQFATISKASIWHDEGFSMMLSSLPPDQILTRTSFDVHPPLYYLALHFWTNIFGTSELAARSLSAMAMLGVILIGFLLVRKLFGDKSARLAALFLATGPFLIRYGQEARMYGLVAFLLLLATYLLIRALESNRWNLWLLYSLAIALSLYTHYFSVFIILVHWLYVLLRTRLVNPRWWVSNVLAAAMYLPWVPQAYAQFSRGQGVSWIPKVTPLTMPSTIGQFLTYTDLGGLPTAARITLFGLLVVITTAAIIRFRKTRLNLILMATYALLTLIIIWGLSLVKPIYVDRYFVFCAVGFYMLLAILLTLSWLKPRLRQLLIVIVLVTFGYGIRNVAHQSDHAMRRVGDQINQDYQIGDDVISGELYTYFDFSYYNATGVTPKLLAPRGITGIGETSLLVGRKDEIVIADLDQLRPATGRVWVVGKTGKHDYFDRVPSSWTLIGQPFEAGYVATRLYLVK